MKKTLTLLLILEGIISSVAFSQPSGKMNLGVGAGLDYGGFGGQISYLPVERVALFGALGYNLAGAGYNLGAKLNFPSKKRVEFHIAGMYGYNAVLIVKDNTTSETIYYGPSIGAGLVIKSRNPGKAFWNMEILLPFRPAAFQNDIDDLKMIGYDVKEPLPIGLSFGYHINFL